MKQIVFVLQKFCISAENKTGPYICKNELKKKNLWMFIEENYDEKESSVGCRMMLSNDSYDGGGWLRLPDTWSDSWSAESALPWI